MKIKKDRWLILNNIRRNYFSNLGHTTDRFIGALLYKNNFRFFTYFNYQGIAGEIKPFHRWCGIKKKWIPIK